MTTTTLPELSPAEARFLELVADDSPKDGPSFETIEAARHLLGASRDEIDTISQTPDGVVVRMARPPVPADWHLRNGKDAPPGIAVEYIVVPADRPDASGHVGLALLTPLRTSPMHIYQRPNPALARFYLDAEPVLGRVAEAARELQILSARATAAGAFGHEGPPAAMTMLDQVAEWTGDTFARLVDVARREA